MTIKVEELLREAIRRWLAFGINKPILDCWIGLGTEAEYRPAIKAGLMKWVCVAPPPPRCPNWLQLTPEGEDAIREYLNRKILNSDMNDLTI